VLPAPLPSLETWVPLGSLRGGPLGRGAPGSWGGHAVNVVAYEPQRLTVITWGAKKRMTWTFWDAYCDEAYGILTKDFIDKAKGAPPQGFELRSGRRTSQRSASPCSGSDS